MTEGFSIRQIRNFSGLSASTLRRILHHWLNRPPVPVARSAARYLIFDGTFLFQRRGLVAVLDGLRGEVLHGQYGVHENSQRQRAAVFTPLQRHGLSPISCTLDGNPQAIRVLQRVWPTMLIQRCLVHLQRQGLMGCRRHPSRPDAQRLRALFLGVPAIRTPRQRDAFLAAVRAWEDRYGSKLVHRPARGWVLSDLLRARSMLLHALPHMFHYLTDPMIPATTNGLEGYFARLKNHYRQHRGLAPAIRAHYFAWYFHLKPK